MIQNLNFITSFYAVGFVQPLFRKRLQKFLSNCTLRVFIGLTSDSLSWCCVSFVGETGTTWKFSVVLAHTSLNIIFKSNINLFTVLLFLPFVILIVEKFLLLLSLIFRFSSIIVVVIVPSRALTLCFADDRGFVLASVPRIASELWKFRILTIDWFLHEVGKNQAEK